MRAVEPPGPPKPSGQPRYLGPSPAVSPWTQLTNQPPISPGSMLLMTDGTVLVHQDNTGAWAKLTPSSKGSYINGTWSQVAGMPSGYTPLYFASAVLNDGRMIIEGGEYNGSGTAVWTNLGAIYNPRTNTWTSVAPPSGWSQIGDAQSVQLTNGRFMMADITSGGAVTLNQSTLAWTPVGTGKADNNDEEGWTLLPNGKVLTVDVFSAPGSEVFSPGTGQWTSAGTVPVMLPDGSPHFEMGPQVLRPQGSVFAVGATGNTAWYSSSTGWHTGPSLPNNIDGNGQYDSADGPASILPNGNVLVAGSPGDFNSPTHFWVYNGSTFSQVADTAFAPNDSTYFTRMLALPNGQVLFDDGSEMEVYRVGGTPSSTWAPTISSLSSTTLTRGTTTYTVSGTQLAGRSNGAAYGDDFQDNTNYPLVRITNNASGAVTYARTFGMTSYSVAPNVSSSAKFQVLGKTPTGPSTLVVVTNGIPSAPQDVTIQ